MTIATCFVLAEGDPADDEATSAAKGEAASTLARNWHEHQPEQRMDPGLVRRNCACLLSKAAKLNTLQNPAAVGGGAGELHLHCLSRPDNQGAHAPHPHGARDGKDGTAAEPQAPALTCVPACTLEQAHAQGQWSCPYLQ